MAMQTGIRTQEVNPAKLDMLYRKEVELSRVHEEETVVLLTDLSTRRGYVEASFAAADELGADVYERLCRKFSVGAHSAKLLSQW